MKKIMCVLVVMALCLTACGALAQGDLVVKEQTYTPVELFTDSYYGYVFARLENTGTENAYFDRGTLSILDAAGQQQAEKTIFTCYPNVVAPGESAYLFAYESVDGVKSTQEIGAHRLEILDSEALEAPPTMLCVTEARYVQEEDLFGEPVYKIYVTVMNETDEALFTPSVVFGLYDQNDALMYVDAMTLFDMGVPAGQSFIMTFSIDDSFKAAWDAQGITPQRVEGIAMVQY